VLSTKSLRCAEIVLATDNGAPWGSLIEGINQSFQTERNREYVVRRDGVGVGKIQSIRLFLSLLILPAVFRPRLGESHYLQIPPDSQPQRAAKNSQLIWHMQRLYCTIWTQSIWADVDLISSCHT